MSDAESAQAMSPSERRAAAFRRTREAHKSEVAEDYVELIGDLIAGQGEARLTDVAENMAVTQATAAKIVARLKREGLVENKPYRSLFLTPAGTQMADRSRVRHRVVYDFLRALGIEDAVAEADSEGIEHHVSDVTLAAIAELTARLSGHDDR
ncbi:manganese-binding transcriptional regulator MntR [Sphingomonas xinjiangensis]|uniref:Transcriptional regulator MntR n=1 Tax=Sphingomonas xinjiangensis TaxID=643568 RepID=A0A840Y954_9SPHN|nr:manganese-binding transcriptional regulator MntR [Sphingomonas xinjiangensis]MBB5709374.1 DtxR family manganese transport transcriptional regulator [Sphingomonas xinjiangensis]